MFADTDQTDIRDSVRRLCAYSLASTYWRKPDAERAYPSEFVAALTGADSSPP
jgi:acyl-CoA dehydrogenase